MMITEKRMSSAVAPPSVNVIWEEAGRVGEDEGPRAFPCASRRRMRRRAGGSWNKHSRAGATTSDPGTDCGDCTASSLSYRGAASHHVVAVVFVFVVAVVVLSALAVMKLKYRDSRTLARKVYKRRRDGFKDEAQRTERGGRESRHLKPLDGGYEVGRQADGTTSSASRDQENRKTAKIPPVRHPKAPHSEGPPRCAMQGPLPPVLIRERAHAFRPQRSTSRVLSVRNVTTFRISSPLLEPSGLNSDVGPKIHPRHPVKWVAPTASASLWSLGQAYFHLDRVVVDAARSASDHLQDLFAIYVVLHSSFPTTPFIENPSDSSRKSTPNTGHYYIASTPRNENLIVTLIAHSSHSCVRTPNLAYLVSPSSIFRMAPHRFVASGLALAAVFLARSAVAHTWIEEMQVIGSNGSYVGDRGYSRGYVARTDPTFTGFSVNYLVPQVGVRINSSDSLCHPDQRSSNYTNPAYPKLKAAPGDYVAMKYLENGHVTLPENQAGKPENRGTVYVYGTYQPADDEKLIDVLQWTEDGSGGNGKGFMMTAQNFDDGRCHQINCGNISTYRQTHFPSHQIGQPTSTMEQWCETDLEIPNTVTTGTLTVYWVWQWPTSPNADCTYPDGKDEYYTSCSDMEIVDEQDQKMVATAAPIHTLVQEAPQSTAVMDYKSRTAATSSPAVVYMKGTTTVGTTTSADASFNSACASSRSAGIVPTPNTSVQTCAVITSFATQDATLSADTSSATPSSITPSQPTSTMSYPLTTPTSLPNSSEASDVPQTSTAPPVSFTTTAVVRPSSSTDSLNIPTISTVGAPAPSGQSAVDAPTIDRNGMIVARRGHSRAFVKR
nr:hypothetical protein CFP56_52794 [Quercus suber]